MWNSYTHTHKIKWGNFYKPCIIICNNVEFLHTHTHMCIYIYIYESHTFDNSIPIFPRLFTHTMYEEYFFLCNPDKAGSTVL